MHKNLENKGEVGCYLRPSPKLPSEGGWALCLFNAEQRAPAASVGERLRWWFSRHKPDRNQPLPKITHDSYWIVSLSVRGARLLHASPATDAAVERLKEPRPGLVTAALAPG